MTNEFGNRPASCAFLSPLGNNDLPFTGNPIRVLFKSNSTCKNIVTIAKRTRIGLDPSIGLGQNRILGCCVAELAHVEVVVKALLG